jgi:hypothetical protein
MHSLFIFYHLRPIKNYVVDAYSMSAQGFFIKDNSASELDIKIMVEYWRDTSLKEVTNKYGQPITSLKFMHQSNTDRTILKRWHGYRFHRFILK